MKEVFFVGEVCDVMIVIDVMVFVLQLFGELGFVFCVLFGWVCIGVVVCSGELLFEIDMFEQLKVVLLVVGVIYFFDL